MTFEVGLANKGSGDPWAGFMAAVMIKAIRDLIDPGQDTITRLDALLWLANDGRLFSEALDLPDSRELLGQDLSIIANRRVKPKHTRRKIT